MDDVQEFPTNALSICKCDEGYVISNDAGWIAEHGNEHDLNALIATSVRTTIKA